MILVGLASQIANPVAVRRVRAPAFSQQQHGIDALVTFWFASLSPQPDTRVDDSELAQLVQAAQGGDWAASHKIYRQCVAMVFRTVRSMCRSEAEAEDVVQDTFVQALSGLSGYRPRPRVGFQSWLVTIAMNGARKRMRWHRRVVLTDDEPEVAANDQMTADEQLQQARNKRALLTAREIVALRYACGLGWAEVAQLVGLTESNVRKIGERLRGKRRRERGCGSRVFRSRMPQQPLDACRARLTADSCLCGFTPSWMMPRVSWSPSRPCTRSKRSTCPDCW